MNCNIRWKLMPQLFQSMTKEEEKLAEALRERLKIISDETSRQYPDQHIARLREISERIESLAATLPHPIPTRLAHYLDRRSYDKALALLEGRGD
jgi:hypothetical protein